MLGLRFLGTCLSNLGHDINCCDDQGSIWNTFCCCGLGYSLLGPLNPFKNNEDIGYNRMSNNLNNLKNNHTNIMGFGMDGKKTKYLDYTWNRLPHGARSAATNLGYNQNLWDSDGWVECCDKWWEDLNYSERENAIALGWDQSAWDNNYEDNNWVQLPQQVMNAVSSLGWNQQMWDSDEWPESIKHKNWDQLSPDQQKALHVLGYYRSKWD